MKKEKNSNRQIERLKKICLDKHFDTGGDIHSLLEKEILVNLLNKRPISKGKVKLTSSIVYGKDILTTEEKFIENLNIYIGFVRDNYHICHIEQLMLIELSLTTPYVDVLYSTLDFHKDDNYNYYHNNFRRLFFATFYNNIIHYANDKNIDVDYKKFIEEIKDYDYENDEDIIELDKILTKVINIRKDNLYQAFLPYTEYKKNDLFHINQINWIISDYYKEKRKENEELTRKLIETCNKVQKCKKINRILNVVCVLLIPVLIYCFVWVYNNKDFIYILNGESDNFSYNNSLFIKSGNVYYLMYGNIKIKNEDIKITNVRLMCDDRLIIGSSQFLEGVSREQKGYDELFPKEVVKNIDNWYYEITYMLDDKEQLEILKLINKSE